MDRRAERHREQSDALAPALVGDVAAFDFNCPKDEITVTTIGAYLYGATGCGQRASYTQRCEVNLAIAPDIRKEACSVRKASETSN